MQGPLSVKKSDPDSRPGKVVIVGGGLMGVTTLYELASRGVPATLLESEDELARGASYANGALITPSLSDPWNSPGVWRHLLTSLFYPKAPMKIRLRAIPGMTFWGLRFLRHSTAARHQQITEANFMLSHYSQACLAELTRHLDLNYQLASPGILTVYQSEDALLGPMATARKLQPSGLDFRRLGREETLALEPRLEGARDRIACSLYYPSEQTGDARLFTLGLAEHAKRRGGIIRTGVRVRRLLQRNDRTIGVETDAGDFLGDVVLAAGVDAPWMARQAGISVRIKPAKGYSLTVDASTLGDSMPRIPVMDDALHAAVVPLGKRLRFVGTAEFTGRDLRIRPERIENFIDLFESLFPQLARELDLSGAEPWAGLRPVSCDGAPWIGPTRARGLWLNCGHGALGWTMAAGSARLLADMMTGQSLAIDATPFRSGR
jgi:D-amino-acid dehydrogenase